MVVYVGFQKLFSSLPELVDFFSSEKRFHKVAVASLLPLSEKEYRI